MFICIYKYIYMFKRHDLDLIYFGGLQPFPSGCCPISWGRPPFLCRTPRRDAWSTSPPKWTESCLDHRRTCEPFPSNSEGSRREMAESTVMICSRFGLLFTLGYS